MSQDKKNNPNPLPILIDFVNIKNPKPDESDQKYEITETAARLSNQLIRDYPRLFQNETIMIKCLQAVIEELGRLHHDEDVRYVIFDRFGQHNLQKMVMALSDMVRSLRASHKVSESVMGVIKDVSDGYRIHLH